MMTKIEAIGIVRAYYPQANAFEGRNRKWSIRTSESESSFVISREVKDERAAWLSAANRIVKEQAAGAGVRPVQKTVVPASQLGCVGVRIAVAINANGEWKCAGWCDDDKDLIQAAVDELRGGYGRDASPVMVHFVEADVPIPSPSTIEGAVVP